MQQEVGLAVKTPSSNTRVLGLSLALAPDPHLLLTQTLESSYNGSRNWVPAHYVGDLP